MTKNPRSTSTLPLEERPIEDIWDEYRKAGCARIRKHLLEKYLHIVKYTADRMYTKLPNEVDVDDLRQAGIFGLMDALESFDPDRGVKFETYCSPRIYGAILDQLRAIDWVPRLVRSRTAKVETARRRFEKTKGRKPTRSELADELDLKMSEFEKIEKDVGPTGMVSLNRKCFETDSSRDIREIDIVRDRRQPDPMSNAQRRDLREVLTRGLSRGERLIILLYYFEELTMKEIGATLDLSESRVSQMHSSILQRLKAEMSKRSSELKLGAFQ